MRFKWKLTLFFFEHLLGYLRNHGSKLLYVKLSRAAYCYHVPNIFFECDYQKYR